MRVDCTDGRPRPRRPLFIGSEKFTNRFHFWRTGLKKHKHTHTHIERKREGENWKGQNEECYFSNDFPRLLIGGRMGGGEGILFFIRKNFCSEIFSFFRLLKGGGPVCLHFWTHALLDMPTRGKQMDSMIFGRGNVEATPTRACTCGSVLECRSAFHAWRSCRVVHTTTPA